MLSADLRTLGDQLSARQLEAMPLDPAEVEAIVACLRSCERAAMALEALPAAGGQLIPLAERRRERAGRQSEEASR